MKFIPKARVFVSGSLAYDRIMDYPGFFADHIVSGKKRTLNISFMIPGLRESFGGTAGNIAYSLGLLGVPSTVLATAGHDFGPYRAWLARHRVDVSPVRIVRRQRTAACYIVTDQADNQISAFMPGASRIAPVVSFPSLFRRHRFSKSFVVLSPGTNEHTASRLATSAARLGASVVFDPGQRLTVYSASQLKAIIRITEMLITNDYELALLVKHAGVSLLAITRRVRVVVTTLGAKGSIIRSSGSTIRVHAARPKNTSDPTGAGDAYRAGFLAGLVRGYPLVMAGRLASTVAVYTVERFGTQTHRFTQQQLKERYYQNFRERLY